VLHGLSPNLIFRTVQPAGPGVAADFELEERLKPAPDSAFTCSDNACSLTPRPELVDPEYITIAQLKDLLARDEAIVIDARSDRTYEESDEEIPRAIRLHPNDPVGQARRKGVPQDTVLAVLCA